MKWSNKDSKQERKRPGCAHCFKGWVKHYKEDIVTGRKYDAANPCAYCFDSHTAPMMILRDGRLYWASRKVDKLDLRDLNNLEACPSNFFPGWKNDEAINKNTEKAA